MYIITVVFRVFYVIDELFIFYGAVGISSWSLRISFGNVGLPQVI